MATFASFMVPSGDPAIQILGLAGSTSSAEISLGTNRIFGINADQDVTIKFGQAGLGAATGVEYRLPANSQTTFDTGDAFASIRVFNKSATAVNIYIQKLSRS